MKAIVLLTLVAAAGCDDKAQAGSGTTLPKLGLVMNVSGAKVMTYDAPGKTWTAGPPDASVRIDKVTIDVAAAAPTYAQTIEAAKAEIQAHPNLDGRHKKEPTHTFQRFTKEQAIEGGWHLEYEYVTPLDKDEPSYGVLIQRTIGGKVFQCGQNTWKPEYRDTIVKACLGLQKK